MSASDLSYYLALGWHHIISWNALDHLYFIAALSVAYPLQHWKKLLLLITAFTLGHAATLFMSALDLIRFKDQWVEFAIPCTIVLSCMSNFRKKQLSSGSDYLQYLLVLVFGFVHGMGYANAIRFIITSEQNLLMSLFGFNIGLEIGQIFVVLLVLAVGWVVMKINLFSEREWVLSSSSLLLGLALKLTIERYPF